MLSFSFMDVNGETFTYDNPLYIIINRDENIPADDLTVAFPLIKASAEFTDITVYDGNKIIFKGIVDEQQNLINEKDCYTKLTARSMAAVLLDNESKPVSYTNPSTYVIFNRHLYPNAIDKYKGTEAVLDGHLKISKGMSDWQALCAFSLRVFNKTPRVEADGTVNFNGTESDLELYFSNLDGINYNSIKENNKRCRLISDIFVKTSSSDFYDTVISDEDISSRNIHRVRYLDASAGATLSVADAMIYNSKNNSYEITLTVPKRLVDVLGAKAVINDESLGEMSELYITGIYYRMTTEREETVLTLKKENGNVAA